MVPLFWALPKNNLSSRGRDCPHGAKPEGSLKLTLFPWLWCPVRIVRKCLPLVQHPRPSRGSEGRPSWVSAEPQSLPSWVKEILSLPVLPGAWTLRAGLWSRPAVGQRPDPNPQIPSNNVGSSGAEPRHDPAPSRALGRPLQTCTFPQLEPPHPGHPQTRLSRALATVLLRSQPPTFFSLEMKTQEVQTAVLVGPEGSALIYSISHSELKGIWAPLKGRGNHSRPHSSPVDAEFIAQMEAPPALLEPLLSHAPEQLGAALAFASVSQDKRNQKLHLKLKVLLQVTKLLISARPQSLGKNCHYSYLLQLGRWQACKSHGVRHTRRLKT